MSGQIPGGRLAAACVALLAAGAMPLGAEETCAGWLEPAFWQQATAERVRDCATPARIAQRTEAGETPLHLAAAHAKDAGAVQALLHAGADPTLVQLDGQTALHRAAGEGALPALVPMLVLHGADVNALYGRVDWWGEDGGVRPIHRAAERADGAAMVAALLASGADHSLLREDRRSALHLATMVAEDTAVVDLLLAAGAEVDAEDTEGWQPLHFAAAVCKDTAVVRRLLEQGADPDAENETEPPQTPLRVAANRARDPACFELLATNSEDPCATDDTGKDAADYAADNPALKGTAAFWALHDLCRRAE